MEIMISKSIKIKEIKNRSLDMFNSSNDCKVSKASNEIMLHRFYNGNRIEFPFSK